MRKKMQAIVQNPFLMPYIPFFYISLWAAFFFALPMTLMDGNLVATVFAASFGVMAEMLRRLFCAD